MNIRSTICTGIRNYIQYYVDGKRFRQYAGNNKKLTADQNMQELIKTKNEIDNRYNTNPYYKKSIVAVIDALVADKKLYQKKRAYDTTCSNSKLFKTYLIKCNLDNLLPGEITDAIINNFINSELKRKVTTRTVNNAMIEIKSLFRMMMDKNIITTNPCKFIRKLPSRSEKNVAYTDTEMLAIKNWLQVNDNYLAIYCRCIAAFIRNDAILNLRIENIDLINGFITLPASIEKTSVRTTKRIPPQLLMDLQAMQLHNYPKKYFLFSRYGKPGPVKCGKNFFCRKFKKLKYDLGFDRHHTMYGIRHTFVSNLLVNGANPADVKQLTGHLTWASFEYYVKSIKSLTPVDLTNKFTISI